MWNSGLWNPLSLGCESDAPTTTPPSRTDNSIDNTYCQIYRPVENGVSRWSTDIVPACCRTVVHVPARWLGRTRSAARQTDHVTLLRCQRRLDADVHPLMSCWDASDWSSVAPSSCQQRATRNLYIVSCKIARCTIYQFPQSTLLFGTDSPLLGI